MSRDFSHIVIGGGAIGLAIAARLVAPTTTSLTTRRVLLLESHHTLGSETSSRNSEVIHAGLYYPPDSLKTSLCIAGNRMLYNLFDRTGIKYRNCGKWIVAQDERQTAYLSSLHAKSKSLGVPTRWISNREAREREPGVRVGECALESEWTGIMDSHGLMQYLHAQIVEGGGQVVTGTRVDGIERCDVSGGYRLFTSSTPTSTKSRHHTSSAEEEDEDEGTFEVTSDVVINSSGLSAAHIANMILPTASHITQHFAKGQYFSYSPTAAGEKSLTPGRLIYPCPEPELDGLGTHLTMDLSGAIRFGPDVTWLPSSSSSSSFSSSTSQFEPDYTTPSGPEADAVLDDVYAAVSKYFPTLQRSGLAVDYCGIRPKLNAPGTGTADFLVREESERGADGFVNLVGMESPGLTSCLAVAEYVEKMVK